MSDEQADSRKQQGHPALVAWVDRIFQLEDERHARAVRLAPRPGSYHVNVTPEDSQFLAQIRGLPSATHADTLTQLEEHVRKLTILGADLPDDAQPAFTFHYLWPEPGHPSLKSDAELFDDPEEMAVTMEDFGVSVDQVRMGRASGLI